MIRYAAGARAGGWPARNPPAVARMTNLSASMHVKAIVLSTVFLVAAVASHGERVAGAEYARTTSKAMRTRDVFQSKARRNAFDDEMQQLAMQRLTGIIINDLIPHWYGTPWSFNGTTQVPGEGSIACGYFVTTVLRDAGVSLDRVALAQAASEKMIKALTPESEIKRYSSLSVDDFERAVLGLGDGLYIVGLDYHTGFIHVRDSEARFIHSGGNGVISQPFSESPEMTKSAYRVVGRISTPRFVREHWIGE